VLNQEKAELQKELQREYSAQERLQKEARRVAKRTGLPDDLVKQQLMRKQGLLKIKPKINFLPPKQL
jgi:hypothetical protein